MKFVILFGILIAFAYVSAQSPSDAVYDGPTYELTPIDDGGDVADDQLGPVRQRRVTCDLLSLQSKWLSVNHVACAARCLAQRRKGGSCRNGVCVCRR